MVCYSDKTATGYDGGTQVTAITSATTTKICDTPAASTIRDIDSIHIKNTYAGSHTVTVQVDANGTNYPLVTASLLTDESLNYTHGSGWQAKDADGNTKTSLSSTMILPISSGGTGQATAQDAINALTAVSAATNEYVLTKDTATGNAIFKAAAGGGGDMLLGTAQTVTASKSFNDGTLILKGATSGTTTLKAAAEAGTTTVTLPAATGTVALTSNKLSAFAKTSSAELAGVISDETGSGSLVFATSPTLDAAVAKGTWTASGTWTLPAFTLGGNITLNGKSFSGTCADGGSFTTIDINGGTLDGTAIGGTTPAAGKFTTLDIS